MITRFIRCAPPWEEDGTERYTPYFGTVLQMMALAVVLKLKELLEEQGIRVVLTRDKDIFMKLEERVQIANGERQIFL